VRAPESIRRLLVIRHRAGGDVLLTTPALRALRAGLPGASIDVVTSRGFRGILEGNPDVSRILDFDPRSNRSQASLYARLLRGGYDAVLDLVSNPRSAWMTAFTRAPLRMGYNLRGRSWAYTVRLPREPLTPDGWPIPRYAPEAALDFVRALGLPTRGLALTFHVSPEAEASIDRWLAESGIDRSRPLVACLPTGSWPAKSWPTERFAAVMDRLAPQAEGIWCWGPGERAAADACRARMRARSTLAPDMGWQELGALLKRCAVWIGNDSGPKHVAVALGVPTVTVFGPTNPINWHPPEGPHRFVEADGLDCLHCNESRCPLTGDRHMRCMRDVTVERVSDTARALLDARVREAPCASA